MPGADYRQQEENEHELYELMNGEPNVDIDFDTRKLWNRQIDQPAQHEPSQHNLDSVHQEAAPF